MRTAASAATKPPQQHCHRVEIVDVWMAVIERAPEMVAAPQDRGGVGAEAEEGMAAEADLAAIAGDEVPTLRHDGVEEDEEQEGEIVGVDGAGQERQQRQHCHDDDCDPSRGSAHRSQAFL